MILYWLGDAGADLSCCGRHLSAAPVLAAARGILPHVHCDPRRGRRGSKDLDAVPLLLTTQAQVKQTVRTVANFGGSLDVILDDA